MIDIFIKLLKREIKLSIVNISIVISYSSFFLMSLLIFTFGIGPDIGKLNELYSPIVWLIMLFSIILISENFLMNDYRDGSLKELQYLGYSEELIIFSKTVVMFLILIIPHFFLIPICSILLNLNSIELINLSINVILGCPSLILISLISNLLTIQVRQSKVLQFVIIMPFYVPLIIFITASNPNDSLEIIDLNKFLILIGFFLITLPIALFSGKIILREVNK